MRDCFFLVADRNMEAMFKGFLGRKQFHFSLGCGEFSFDPDQDIEIAAGDNDPGLYSRGHEMISGYQRSHRHAVIVLDAEWDGSPGKVAIVRDLGKRIAKTGWEAGNCTIIVIDPELENWIWQRNVHVAKGLGYSNNNEMLNESNLSRVWPTSQDKPSSPKETLEAILRKHRISRSSSLYGKIASKVSVMGCKDAAFQELQNQLQTWFPPS